MANELKPGETPRGEKALAHLEALPGYWLGRARIREDEAREQYALAIEASGLTQLEQAIGHLEHADRSQHYAGLLHINAMNALWKIGRGPRGEIIHVGRPGRTL